MKLTLLLICDVSDESRNFYNDVQTASTSEEFSNLKSQSVSAVYDYRSGGTGQTTAASSYKVITLITQTHIQIFAPNKGMGVGAYQKATSKCWGYLFYQQSPSVL